MTQPRAQAPQPKFAKYDNLEQVMSDVRELYRLMQPKTMRIFSTVPIATDLVEGEEVLYDNETTTRRIYTKLNGTIRRVDLT